MKKGIKTVITIAVCAVIVALIATFIVLWKRFEDSLPTVDNNVTPTVSVYDPTGVPTATPTGVLTATPTSVPTVTPTNEPQVTDAPTVTETPEPTDVPAVTDAPEPTAVPTEAPEVEPTPTETPVVPTEAPTPTTVPTSAPTATPTPTPTNTPTPTPAPDRSYVKEEKRGKNAWFRLTEDGVLYVTGKGALYSITGEDAFFDLAGYRIAHTIIIEEGITKIGDWALAYFRNTSIISFPSTITELGDYCFFDSAKPVKSVFVGLDLDKVKLNENTFAGVVYQTQEDVDRFYGVEVSPTPTPVTEPMKANSFYKALVEEAGFTVDKSKSDPYSAVLVSKGIIASSEVKGSDETFANQEIAKILYHTAKAVGITGDSEVIANAKKYERISDKGGIVPGYEEAVYFCFGTGIMPGFSDGEYSHTRSFEPKKTMREADGIAYIERLFDEDKRVPMSPDAQVIRTTNLPIQAKLYPYILESFPNEYYDANYHYMGNIAVDDRTSEYVQTNKFMEEWCTASTMDEYSEKNPKRCYWFNDPDNYIGYEKVSANFIADRYRDQWEEQAKRYLELILNFDYRTVRSDTAWQEEIKNLNCYYTDWFEGRLSGSDAGIDGIDKWMSAFVDCAEKYKTVVQCSEIDFDMSTLAYSEVFNENAPFTIRVHLKYKIDTEVAPGLFFTNSAMILPTSFVRVETYFESFNEWKDVYAELTFNNNSFDRAGVVALRINESYIGQAPRYHFDPQEYVD